MALGTPPKRQPPLGVMSMLAALVIAAFLGSVLGLVWQNSGWFDDDLEEEVVTKATPTSN